MCEPIYLTSAPPITMFINLRLSLVSKLIYGPQQHVIMFKSSYINHLDMSS